MSELIENTVRLVDEFNNEIKSDLSSKGIDDTREASNSIRTIVKENKEKINIQSVGIDYLYYLDQGRGPGKFPPVDKIEEWVINKPVEINPYLVGRKIAREGTEIFKNRSKGIMLFEKRKKVLDIIGRDSAKWAKNDMLKKIKEQTKNLK